MVNQLKSLQKDVIGQKNVCIRNVEYYIINNSIFLIITLVYKEHIYWINKLFIFLIENQIFQLTIVIKYYCFF